MAHVLPRPHPVSGEVVQIPRPAATKYAAGRGELLRRRGGMDVSTPRELGGGYRFVQLLAGLFLGIISISTPASLTFALPTHVTADPAQDLLSAKQEILWAPDLATGGFPVMPTRKAA